MLKKAVVFVGAMTVSLGLLAVGGVLQVPGLGDDVRSELEELREEIRSSRTAVVACRRSLSRAEARFQAYDRQLDSLKEEVRAYEELHPEGVPADSFQVYLEAFDLYNESVPEWSVRADSLREHWEQCRELTREHNVLVDSARRILVDLRPDGPGAMGGP